MKTTLFSAVLLFNLILLSKVLYANQEEEQIPVVAFWEKGDFHYYEITKTSNTIRNGVNLSNITLSYLASFMVMEARNDGYTIKWRIEGLKNDHHSFTSNKEGNNSLSEFIGTDIIYKTTSTGEFIEFLNQNEIEAKLRSTFSNLYPNKPSISKTESIFKNQEQTLPVLEEIKLFHSLFGLQFLNNKEIKFKDSRIGNKVKFELDGIFLPKNINNGEAVGIFTNVLTLNKENLFTNHTAIEKIKSAAIDLSQINFEEKEKRTINYEQGLVLSIFKETKATFSEYESETTSLAIKLVQ